MWIKSARFPSVSVVSSSHTEASLASVSGVSSSLTEASLAISNQLQEAEVAKPAWALNHSHASQNNYLLFLS